MFKRFLCLLALAMFAAAPLSADVRADSVLLAYDASSSTKLPPPRWWGEAGSGVSIQSLDDRPTLSFEREDTGGNLLIHARVRLPEGAEAVQTTLDARASEITGGKKPHHGATVVLIFEDDAKKPVGYGNIRADAGGDGIANFAKTHPVPAGATHVKLSMGLWQVAGRFDVAAFSIAVPEPEPAEPASAPAAIDGPLHELRIDPSVDAGGFKKLVREVNDRLDRGVGVRVVFAPGVYRLPVNTLVFEGEPGGSADAPLVLEAEAPDTVFLRGSVERSAEFDPSPGNWSPVEGHRGVYAIDWPYRFEKSIGYWAHRYGFPFRRESMRRELLAINGQMMLPRELEKYVWEDPDGPFFSNDKKAGNRPGRYVADGLVDGGLSVLRPGEFAVADRPGTPAPLGRKLFVKLPKGMTWGDVERVEFGAIGAGDEDALIRVANRNNVELRNLTVEHMPGDMLSEGVMLYGVNGFRVEGCDISCNGGRGLVMSRVADGVITGSRFNRNGQKGVGGGRIDGLLIEDTHMNFNNWRGRYGFVGWDSAGVKFGNTRGVTIRDSVFVGNLTGGVWFDIDNIDTVVERVFVYGNFRPGVEFELTNKPGTGNSVLRDSVVGENFSYGVFVSDSAENHLTGNVVFNNGSKPFGPGILSLYPQEQIGFTNNPTRGPRTAEAWGANTMHDNFVYDGGPFRLFGVVHTKTPASHYDMLFSTMTVGNNTFVHAERDPVFMMPNHAYDSLAAWESAGVAAGMTVESPNRFRRGVMRFGPGEDNAMMRRVEQTGVPIPWDLVREWQEAGGHPDEDAWRGLPMDDDEA